MINVSGNVKDSLKSGEYKKKYRITLVKASADEYHKIDTLNFGISGYSNSTFIADYNFAGLREGDSFKFSCPTSLASFSDLSWVDTSGETPVNMSVNAMTDGTNTWVDMTFHEKYKVFVFYLNNVSFAGESEAILPIDVYAQIEIIDDFIDNENLVADSVKFDERMCSDKELKFGLCEGTSIEFQYFGKRNIYGERIKVDIDVQYKIRGYGSDADRLEWQTIPMGYFDVDECSRQASTGIIKVIAINKLKSKYLDSKINAQIEEMIIADSQHQVGIYALLNNLLSGFSIGYNQWIDKSSKLYSVNNVKAYGKNQILVWTYKDGEWYGPGQYGPPYGPTTGWITVYMADFWFIPTDELNQYTNEYYNYTIDLSKIWEAVKFIVKSSWFDAIGYLQRDGYFENIGYNEGSFQSPSCVHWNDWIETAYSSSEFSVTGHVTLPDGRIYSLNGHRKGSSERVIKVETGDFTGEFPRITVPIMASGIHESVSSTTEIPFSYDGERADAEEFWYPRLQEILQALKPVEIKKRDLAPIEEYKIQMSEFEEISGDVTLRDIQSAVFEINCQYGKLDRVTDLFSGIELNNGALYPRDSLYPAEGLYPSGNSTSSYPAMYEKLWADEGNVRSFKYLIITYKTTKIVDGQTVEGEATLQRTVNEHGTDNYNMSDNWLFRNFSWTAEQVGAYADAMVLKMRDIRWFPFEMWCPGLPYLEAGDKIEIEMQDGTHPSYILRRYLKGIQDLHDEMVNGTLDIF